MVDWKEIGQSIDLKELNEQTDQQISDYKTQLKNESRSLEELVEEKTFEVRDVLGTSHQTCVTPRSEIMLGGISPKYQSGYISRVEYSVKPVKGFAETTIKSIIFEGPFPPVFVGNTIAVQIPLFEKKSLHDKFPFVLNSQNESFYLPRECKKQEKAIEILILDPKNNNSQLGRFRSVDYCDYFPKN